MKGVCCQYDLESLSQRMEFLRLFKLLNNTFLEEINRRIRELDLTASQMDVLMSIASHRGAAVNQKDIEGELRLSNPTVTGILKRLESKGFVEREVDEKDRRYKKVRLTPKCEQLGARLHAGAERMMEHTFRGFTSEEFSFLNQMLARLLENCAASTETTTKLEETT
jgi:MarR family transcriptional repressor of mepA